MNYLGYDSDKYGWVFYPGMERCLFNNLNELMAYLREDGRSDGLLTLSRVVQYNVRYRDRLRDKGIEGVIAMLTDECPSIVEEQKDLDVLCDWWTRIMEEEIADYDIQCLPRDMIWYVMGCRFYGLGELRRQVEMSGCPAHGGSQWWSAEEDNEPNPADLHVGEIWRSYPTFDIYDVGDSRFYRNFIIRDHPITPEDMQAVAKLHGPSNECRVHEFIPHNLLPILYYDGDSGYVLLASEKERRDEGTSEKGRGGALKRFFVSAGRRIRRTVRRVFNERNKGKFWRVVAAVATFCLLVIAFEVITTEFRNEIHYLEHKIRWKKNATEDSYYSFNLSRGYYYNAGYKDKYFIAERETNRHVVDGIDWLCKGSGHHAVVAKNGRRGYFNTVTGKWLVKPKEYTRAWLFSEGTAAVVKDGRMMFIDMQGHPKMGGKSFPYDDTHDYSLFHNGTFAIQGENSKWGIIDLNGDWLLQPVYDMIHYKDGCYHLNMAGEWETVNESLEKEENSNEM